MINIRQIVLEQWPFYIKSLLYVNLFRLFNSDVNFIPLESRQFVTFYFVLSDLLMSVLQNIFVREARVVQLQVENYLIAKMWRNPSRLQICNSAPIRCFHTNFCQLMQPVIIVCFFLLLPYHASQFSLMVGFTFLCQILDIFRKHDGARQ